MSKQSELLDQLKIDRSEAPPGGISLAVVAGIVVVTLVVGAAGGMFLFRDEAPAEAAAPVPARSQSGSTSEASSPGPGDDSAAPREAGVVHHRSRGRRMPGWPPSRSGM